MAAKLSFLFAASAAAQLTTSFWLPSNFLGTNRIRYVGSIIGADEDRLTIAASFDNDTDYKTLGLITGRTDTFTLASTLFEFSTSDIRLVGGVTFAAGEFAQSYRCEMQSTDAAAQCTLSIGSELARGARCDTGAYTGYLSTQTWTFSDPDATGVETIVHSVPSSPSTPVPEWCNGGSNASVPNSELSRTTLIPSNTFGYFKFIITAGEEKLPSATAGGNAATSTVESTSTQASSGGSGPSATQSGNSQGVAPVKTMVPALAGLGAAVAVFL